MKYTKKLLGDTIYLSPRSKEDAEKFVEWLNDFKTTDFIGRSYQCVTMAAEKEYLENTEKEEASFAIVTIQENKLIGSCALEKIDHIRRTATLGIFIGDIEERNKGYGAEAIRLILDYGFHYLNLHSVKLEVLAFNERAISCYRKCGFQEFGKRRESEFLNGKYYDRIYMDILESEFLNSYIRNKNI